MHSLHFDDMSIIEAGLEVKVSSSSSARRFIAQIDSADAEKILVPPLTC
jgi:hypothetical protein